MRIWQQRCPIFTEKIWQSFTFSALWRTSRASFLCIRRVPTCLCWDKSEPLKASSILMRVTYTRKPMTLRWHGSRQSHNDDRAHNIVWICTYSKCLKCILTQQGHEHSWLERVAHIATRVHHTKCTITHIQAYIDIHTSCTMLSHRVGK